MNKHSHIYLYTFIHSGMTVVFTVNGTISSFYVVNQLGLTDIMSSPFSFSVVGMQCM